MLVFDKLKIREALTDENVFDLLQEWGGDPSYDTYGFVSTTICHNPPGEGSRKLYYYTNTGLFRCYTGCDSYFDIFELVSKVAKIQWDKDFDLNDAVRWVAQKFGFSGDHEDRPEDEDLDDWKYLANYERIQDISLKDNSVLLKVYENDILERFNYKVKIRFVGLRGRTVCEEEGERYGKYRPMRVNGIQYNHPLGMNLYNFNNSKDNIKLMKKAIIFEGEKSTLLYQSYFGLQNDISVACCGSSVSAHQMQLLLDAGAEEIIIAFDRQFQEIGDTEFKHLKKNLLKLRDKYKTYATISFIFDKNKTTGYKSSPIDEGPEKFLNLFKERIVL